MYEIKWIRDNQDEFLKGLKRRGLNAEPLLHQILTLDEERRQLVTKVQAWQEIRNRKSGEIALAKKAGEESRAALLIQEVSQLKSDIAKGGEQVIQKAVELDNKLVNIPNIPLEDVPEGESANDNVQHHHFHTRRNYAFEPKQHFELGEALSLMDFEAAAELSGARFVVLKGALARFERALMQFMLDVHTSEHGYVEIAPPLLVRDDAMYGTAQLPKFYEDQFEAYSGRQAALNYLEARKDGLESCGNKAAEHLEIGDIKLTKDKNRYWLIPTAEVPLTNLVSEEIVAEDRLPLRFTAGTPCFRAEAGAAGKDTRGMIRQHQFNKVELVSITTPEQSRAEHERMLACAEEILRRLDLHYRVMVLCAGDTGFASQKTYDIEVWLPGQGAYREISSCSICGEFQARRMNARYRGKDGRVHYVHTLNGSGVAVGRALIAVMETYQQEDGSIVIPEALKPYMGGLARIERGA